MRRDIMAKRGAGGFGARHEQHKTIEKAVIVALYCAVFAAGVSALIVQIFAP